MDTAQMDLFRTVCFIALMQHGKGLISKRPDYIKQKFKTSEDPLAAWQMLDFEVQRTVQKWAEYSDFPLTSCLHEIAK